MAECDTVIFLDISRSICLWRVLKRSILYRRSRRPDMAEGCPERFDLSFMVWVWNYKKRTRPKIVNLLMQHSQNKTVIWLRTQTEVERFLVNPQAA
jgi:adenylate kinase family enzyme